MLDNKVVRESKGGRSHGGGAGKLHSAPFRFPAPLIKKIGNYSGKVRLVGLRCKTKHQPITNG